MRTLTFDKINNAQFKLYEGNPVIRHPWNSFVAADPTVLTPDRTPDKKWHLFCHTFYGINHYESIDGIDFKYVEKVVPRAMRPNINYINGRYYLFYQRVKPLLQQAITVVGAKEKSEIYCTESYDLKSWSKPYRVIGKTRDFEEDEKGQSISNPFLIEKDGGYRLYYSCGQTFIKDCGFCEPTHISFAESKRASSGYISREKPIISPDKNNQYLNLCSGCLKVYRLSDCYIGLQNGIFEKDGDSYSAIMLLRSDDGESFEFCKMFLTPQMCGDSDWMAQYVYACDLTYYEGKLRLYFNARNVANMLRGRESIGFYEAVL